MTSKDDLEKLVKEIEEKEGHVDILGKYFFFSVPQLSQEQLTSKT